MTNIDVATGLPKLPANMQWEIYVSEMRSLIISLVSTVTEDSKMTHGWWIFKFKTHGVKVRQRTEQTVTVRKHIVTARLDIQTAQTALSAFEDSNVRSSDSEGSYWAIRYDSNNGVADVSFYDYTVTDERVAEVAAEMWVRHLERRKRMDAEKAQWLRLQGYSGTYPPKRLLSASGSGKVGA